jgi:hypothetical protein
MKHSDTMLFYEAIFPAKSFGVKCEMRPEMAGVNVRSAFSGHPGNQANPCALSELNGL